MDGETRRGRPCREWLDDIKEGRREQIHIGLLSWKAQDQGTCRMVVRMALDLYTGGEPMEQWMDEMHELVMQLNTLGTIASYLCVGYCGCSRITFGDVEFAITEWPNQRLHELLSTTITDNSKLKLIKMKINAIVIDNYDYYDDDNDDDDDDDDDDNDSDGFAQPPETIF